MPRLRLSLTIPGAVSLGAYESGALAALIVAAKVLGQDTLLIDSIAAGSAGSITGLLAARSLLDGIDPLTLLASASVEDASLRALEAEAADPPLLSDASFAVAASLLGPTNISDVAATTRQEEPVVLSMALSTPGDGTCDPPDPTSDAMAQSWALPDWYIITLTNSATPHEYLAYAEASIAAGRTAAGSDARSGRPLDDEQRCEEAGLLRLPGDGLFWYTVGGAAGNEALDRTIDLAEQIGSDDERLYLVISPDPAYPARSPSDTSGGDPPSPPSVRIGTDTFGRADARSIYEELERLEGASSPFAWIGTAVPAVNSSGDRCNSGTFDPDADAVQFRSSLHAALGNAHESVRHREADIASVAGRIVAEREADYSTDYASLLGLLIDTTSTPARPRHVPVEVVSPAVDPSVDVPAWQQLVGAYCGFFDFTLRHGDFCLGYRNMHYWLEHRLNSYLPIDLSAAVEMVERGYEEVVRKDGRDMHVAVPSFGDDSQLRTPALHAGHVRNRTSSCGSSR